MEIHFFLSMLIFKPAKPVILEWIARRRALILCSVTDASGNACVIRSSVIL